MVALLSADDPAGAYARYLAAAEARIRVLDGRLGYRSAAAALNGAWVALADGSILNRYWDDLDYAAR